jgi:hypothetical protein
MFALQQRPPPVSQQRPPHVLRAEPAEEKELGRRIKGGASLRAQECARTEHGLGFRGWGLGVMIQGLGCGFRRLTWQGSLTISGPRNFQNSSLVKFCV